MIESASKNLVCKFRNLVGYTYFRRSFVKNIKVFYRVGPPSSSLMKFLFHLLATMNSIRLLYFADAWPNQTDLFTVSRRPTFFVVLKHRLKLQICKKKCWSGI